MWLVFPRSPSPWLLYSGVFHKTYKRVDYTLRCEPGKYYQWEWKLASHLQVSSPAYRMGFGNIRIELEMVSHVLVQPEIMKLLIALNFDPLAFTSRMLSKRAHRSRLCHAGG